MARLALLKEAWSFILRDNRADWIRGEQVLAKNRPDNAFAGCGRALDVLKARGATDDELVSLVREVQEQSLYHFCQLINASEHVSDPEHGFYDWGLFEVDEKGKPKARIRQLHKALSDTRMIMTRREKRVHLSKVLDLTAPALRAAGGCNCVVDIEEYLAHDEWGLAFETLQINLEEFACPISLEVYQVMHNLALAMDFSVAGLAGIKALVVKEPTL